MLCHQNRYTLPAVTRAKLLLGFQYLLEHRDEHFGNGRLVRNVFEQSIGRLANRIAGVLPLTRELLTTLQPEDVVLEGVPESVWQDLHDESRAFRLECPGCHHSSRLPQKFLGHRPGKPCVIGTGIPKHEIKCVITHSHFLDLLRHSRCLPFQ